MVQEASEKRMTRAQRKIFKMNLLHSKKTPRRLMETYKVSKRAVISIKALRPPRKMP